MSLQEYYEKIRSDYVKKTNALLAADEEMTIDGFQSINNIQYQEKMKQWQLSSNRFHGFLSLIAKGVIKLS